MARGQVRWPRTQSHPKAPQQGGRRACKAASGREPVPTGVIASDQHKPSVHYEGLEQADDGPPDLALGADQPTVLSGLEVIELEEDLATEPDPLID